MKVIIAGSRSITDFKIVRKAIRKSGFEVTEVVSGKACGVDRLGELYAKRNGLKVKEFPAEWGKYGKSAGFIRNAQMGKYADALIAIWNGSSKGTKHIIDFMDKLYKKVFVLRIKELL